MVLNKKGFAPWALIIAIGAAIIFSVLCMIGTNEYADIPETQAVQTVKSDHEYFTVKKGETVRILGAEYVRPQAAKSSDSEEVMLLIQTAKGERDLISNSIIPDELFQEILSELKKHAFSQSPGLFCRKTMTKAALDNIPLGISIEAMDSLLAPTRKAVMEDGVLKANYSKIQVFDKETGRFYELYAKFKDGGYCGSELHEQKTHGNAWLLKFLPGANWTYDHNIFNGMFSKKHFNSASFKPTTEIKGFLGKLMGFAIVAVLFVIIFGFYAFIPLLPAYTFYGLLLFPPLFKPFDRTLTSIVVIVLTILGYYYVWLTFMPYMSFFLMPIIMVPAAFFGVAPLLSDDICKKCRYMETTCHHHSNLLERKPDYQYNCIREIYKDYYKCSECGKMSSSISSQLKSVNQ